MKTLAISLTAAVALLAAAPPASADEDVDFAFKKSELTSKASIESLYDRMVKRAELACGDRGPNIGLYRIKYRQACVSDLVGDFVAAADSSSLTALHEQRHNERFADSR